MFEDMVDDNDCDRALQAERSTKIYKLSLKFMMQVWERVKVKYWKCMEEDQQY